MASKVSSLRSASSPQQEGAVIALAGRDLDGQGGPDDHGGEHADDGYGLLHDGVSAVDPTGT